MGDLSRHFSRSEFACKCGCGFDTVDYEQIVHLETLRAALGGNRIDIISGCRCEEHNATIPSASIVSQHLKARGEDFTVRTVPPETVADICEELFPKASIGRYEDRTHMDHRTHDSDIGGRWRG